MSTSIVLWPIVFAVAAYKFPAADDDDDLWRGKTLSSLGQLKRAVKWSVFCLRLFSSSFSSLFLFGPVFVSFHLAQQIAG